MKLSRLRGLTVQEIKETIFENMSREMEIYYETKVEHAIRELIENDIDADYNEATILEDLVEEDAEYLFDKIRSLEE